MAISLINLFTIWLYHYRLKWDKPRWPLCFQDMSITAAEQAGPFTPCVPPTPWCVSHVPRLVLQVPKGNDGWMGNVTRKKMKSMVQVDCMSIIRLIQNSYGDLWWPGTNGSIESADASTVLSITHRPPLGVKNFELSCMFQHGRKLLGSCENPQEIWFNMI